MEEAAESLGNLLCALDPPPSLLVIDTIAVGPVAPGQVSKDRGELFIGEDSRPQRPLEMLFLANQQVFESVDVAHTTSEEQAGAVANVVPDGTHHQAAAAIRTDHAGPLLAIVAADIGWECVHERLLPSLCVPGGLTAMSSIGGLRGRLPLGAHPEWRRSITT
jgi:hypothetical protein